jgi:hypothetical protein
MDGKYSIKLIRLIGAIEIIIGAAGSMIYLLPAVVWLFRQVFAPESIRVIYVDIAPFYFLVGILYLVAFILGIMLWRLIPISRIINMIFSPVFSVLIWIFTNRQWELAFSKLFRLIQKTPVSELQIKMSAEFLMFLLLFLSGLNIWLLSRTMVKEKFLHNSKI